MVISSLVEYVGSIEALFVTSESPPFTDVDCILSSVVVGILVTLVDELLLLLLAKELNIVSLVGVELLGSALLLVLLLLFLYGKELEKKEQQTQKK